MKRFFTICLGALIGLLFTLQVTAQKPSCSGNSYSSKIIKEKRISETCTEYEIKVSYDGTRSFGLSHYSIGIPCGTVKNVWNSENWKEVFGKDPTTGVYGLKIDNISGFGGGKAESFTVKFTWCSDNSCDKDLRVVSYKAGQCVDYETLNHQSPQPPQPPQDTVEEKTCAKDHKSSCTEKHKPYCREHHKHSCNEDHETYCKEHHKPSCTEDHSPSCTGNSFSSEVVSKKQISETCIEYKIKVSYDGTKSFGLSHYSIGIPCGNVKNVWNSESWKQVIGKDPTTGVNGLKIDDISRFGDRGADSFIVKFTWCSDNSCNKELGVVAYKAGQCVDYDTLGHQSPPQPPNPPQDTVTTPQPPQPPQPNCAGNSFSSEVVKGVQVSETCIEYEIKVSYDGTKSFGLSHYSIGIPCGDVSNISNSENWKHVFGKDPTTGVYGLKIDDISGFGEGGADSFTVKFTWCSDSSCNKELGVVSYKAGQCVDYDTLDHQMPEPPLPPQDTIPDPPQPPQDTVTTPQDTTTCSSLLASLQKKNATCAAGNDGQIEVTIQEGTAPIVYNWSNGSNTSKVENLAPGTYSVTITDAKGNTLTLSETIASSPPIAITETITNPYCSGAASGAIELSVSGGSGGYSFAWSNGSTQQNINNLAGGLYTVTVSDAIGCSAQKTFMLTNSTLISATASLKNTSCALTDGGIDLTPSGGLAPYTFLWNNGATTEDIQNVGAGIYSVTIKDAAGCSANKQYTVKVNSTLAITQVITPVSCLGGTTGSIDVSVFGGTPPYSYQWLDGPTTEDRSGLSPAQYSVTVTDASGCTAKANLAIFKKPLQVSSNITQPKCAGDLGSIVLTVDGTAPYTYTWSNGETDESITDLPPGFYSVTVTDATGCTRVLDFAIISQIAIAVNSTISNPQCGTEGSFAIDLSVMGGKPPYSFLWSTGATTQNVSGLNAGSYSVSISDAAGCTITREFIVDPFSAGWSCLITQPVAATVCGSVGNLLSTEVTDATAYQWTVTSSDNSWSITSGSTSSTAVYTAGTAGSTATFTLTITKNGCSQTCSYAANSCTVKDNTGGGDPSSDEPCVNSTTATPATESPNETVEEPVQETQDEAFKLEVYPNPFRDKLNFEFTATSNDFVQIEMLDKFGNRITTLYEGNVSKGQHYNFDWTSAGLKDHIYFYRFISSTFVGHGKLLRK